MMVEFNKGNKMMTNIAIDYYIKCVSCLCSAKQDGNINIIMQFSLSCFSIFQSPTAIHEAKIVASLSKYSH